MTAADPLALTTRALNIAKKKSQENLAERLGRLPLLVRLGGCHIDTPQPVA